LQPAHDRPASVSAKVGRTRPAATARDADRACASAQNGLAHGVIKPPRRDDILDFAGICPIVEAGAEVVMSEFLPKEVLAGLEEARRRDLRKRSRLRVHAGQDVYPVLRFWDDGFALDAGQVSHLRGLVDIYDGSRHLYQCLIIASDVEAGELICEMKRSTAALEKAPLDFVRDEAAPVGFLPRL
jgi:hypothetical protein